MRFFNDLRFYGDAIGFLVKISLKISFKKIVKSDIVWGFQMKKPTYISEECADFQQNTIII